MRHTHQEQSPDTKPDACYSSWHHYWTRSSRSKRMLWSHYRGLRRKRCFAECLRMNYLQVKMPRRMTSILRDLSRLPLGVGWDEKSVAYVWRV